MRGMVVVLHNIRSIHNVASVFRTADAAGAEKVYLCGITPGPVDKLGKHRSQFIKVSLGAERTVPYEKRVSTAKLLDELRRDGYEILAVEQSKKSVPYHKFKTRKRKLVLVLGSEVAGLSDAILRQADKILEIPMQGKKESLNVAIAFGIVAYRLKFK